MDVHPRARWPRPVPLIGDPTRAAERAADPRAGRSTRRRLGAARGDRRPPRHPPLPPRPGAAGDGSPGAHGRPQAPSVGHSQPWRFVVVTEQATRDRAAVLADRERLRQAAALDAGLGARACSTCSSRASARRPSASSSLRPPRPGRRGARPGDLPRRRPVVAAPARSRTSGSPPAPRGLGIGWVTLFQPAELADAARTSPTASRPSAGSASAGPTSGRPSPGSSGPAGRARLAARRRRLARTLAGRRASRPAPVSHLRAAGAGRRRAPRATRSTTCSPRPARSGCSTGPSTGSSRCPGRAPVHRGTLVARRPPTIAVDGTRRLGLPGVTVTADVSPRARAGDVDRCRGRAAAGLASSVVDAGDRRAGRSRAPRRA